MDQHEKKDVLGILESHGVLNASYSTSTDPTEEVILISHEEFGRLDVEAVTQELMRVLPHRKVWLAPQSNKWQSAPIQ
jgi:hypothetical protein